MTDVEFSEIVRKYGIVVGGTISLGLAWWRGVAHNAQARAQQRQATIVQRAHVTEVFKHAVRSMAQGANLALKQSGLTADDVDLMIPHQANNRIIEATARYAGIPMDRVYVNVERYGNMSSATIPFALDEAVEEGRLRADMNVLTVAFGAGLTWGAVAFRW